MGASREAALRDIRAKAAATGEEPPDVFDIPVSTTMPADEEETERTTRELEAAAAGNKGVVSDEELKRRKKSLEWLRRRARSHYDDALSLIEK